MFTFLPPVSIVFFDELKQNGELERHFNAEKLTIRMLLDVENIHVYSFFDEFEMICNLDNYKDHAHYGPKINSYILQSIKDGKHEITIDNFDEYYEKVIDFYTQYDYDSIFD